MAGYSNHAERATENTLARVGTAQLRIEFELAELRAVAAAKVPTSHQASVPGSCQDAMTGFGTYLPADEISLLILAERAWQLSNAELARAAIQRGAAGAGERDALQFAADGSPELAVRHDNGVRTRKSPGWRRWPGPFA